MIIGKELPCYEKAVLLHFLLHPLTENSATKEQNSSSANTNDHYALPR
jgi:hypothetical protein